MTSVGDIRYPVVSGSFYPDDGGDLQRELSALYASATSEPDRSPAAMILVPHSAYAFSGITAAWGHAQLPAGDISPHIVIVAPSHRLWYTGMVSSSVPRWRTPLGDVDQIPPTDEYIPSDDAAMDEEYGIEVQLPFLQYRYRDPSVTAILTGSSLKPDVCAQVLLSRYPDSLFVFSTDLSHYLPQEEAVVRDGETIAAILRGDLEYLETTDNCACGSAGIRILMTMAAMRGMTGSLVRYGLSGRSLGDRSAMVGYAAIAFR